MDSLLPFWPLFVLVGGSLAIVAFFVWLIGYRFWAKLYNGGASGSEITRDQPAESNPETQTPEK